MKLDTYDIHILSILQSNGKIKNKDLAKHINLSPSPCWERVKKLEKAGFISAYRAVISVPDSIDFCEFVVPISLSSHTYKSFEEFEKFAGTFEEIRSCLAVGGGFDYILVVSSPTIARYQAMMDELLQRVPSIEKYHTYAVTKRIFSRPELPISLILSDHVTQPNSLK